jgi:hypothetical protein
MLTAAQMQSLPSFFSPIPDPRRPQGRRHRLSTVLGIAAGAVLYGMRGYRAISDWAQSLGLLFAKTLADSKINNTSAALPPLFCYNSWPWFDSLSCPSERWFASCGRVGASSSRISRYANNSPC